VRTELPAPSVRALALADDALHAAAAYRRGERTPTGGVVPAPGVLAAYGGGSHRGADANHPTPGGRMPHYDRIMPLVLGAAPASAARVFEERVVPALTALWLDDYDAVTPGGEVVETTAQGFSYLFDIRWQRLIAAWGVSRGAHTEPRDKGRMAGSPRTGGVLYHRGHAIPHTLGGATDINLVPQLGAVNVGAFRALERAAVATPGALYFTYWSYRGSRLRTARGHDEPGQVPTAVEQGLLVPGAPPRITRHAN
jgi:hypothetical protein